VNVNRISVGVLGATGIVGQRFIQLLAGHPWFQVTAVSASDRSAGQRYADACNWLLSTPIPEAVQDLSMQPLEPHLDCQLVFSAIPSNVARPAEEHFASAGYIVCTNAAPHRLEPDVPLLIPEVNADHTDLIKVQRRRRGWEGFIVASANCSATPLALALKPLQDAFGIRKVSVVTLQAISGAGYPGTPSADILGNVIPFIANEEDKVEHEPRKMVGMLRNGSVVDAPFVVSAQCNRVPVIDGHTACVSVEFESQEPERKPDVDDIVEALKKFRGPPKVANLPSTPERPIVVFTQDDRPQPLRDRGVGKGMSVSVGRVRDCPVLDAKFVVLGHNTLRGAAGGAIHNAELLVAQGWIS
jgi:aspartate-semialdehyde dehydrogenase